MKPSLGGTVKLKLALLCIDAVLYATVFRLRCHRGCICMLIGFEWLSFRIRLACLDARCFWEFLKLLLEADSEP